MPANTQIIYKITNTINNKIYIGQTIKTLDKRWSSHCYDAIHMPYINKFYNAIRKYGIEVWNREVIEEVNDVDLLDEREIFWINYYDTFRNGYNSTTGGERRKIISEESRRKISEKHTGKKLSETHRQNISKGNKGKKDLPEVRERKRLAAIRREEEKRKTGYVSPMKGTTFTLEHKEKLSMARKGKTPWNKGMKFK